MKKLNAFCTYNLGDYSVYLLFDVRVRKTGHSLELFDDLDDAVTFLDELEEADKKNGIYTEDWYDIAVIEEDTHEVLFCDTSFALEITKWWQLFDPWGGLTFDEQFIDTLENIREGEQAFMAECMKEAVDNMAEDLDDECPDWMDELVKDGYDLIHKLAA